MWLRRGTSDRVMLRFVQGSGERLDSLQNCGLVKDSVLRIVSSLVC
jgi:hypothetical protein